MQEDAEAKRKGIRSVPFYLVSAEGQGAPQKLSGSQPVNTMLAVFAKAAAAGSKDGQVDR